jgi:signal transduction histidine kinase/ligand-binding sensor domain-containing protein
VPAGRDGHERGSLSSQPPFIKAILSDSRGFVWFSTRSGLSRFDGLEFRSYTTDDGLPHPIVNDVLETRDGEYWIATNGGGVCRFEPDRRARGDARGSLFACQPLGSHVMANRVNVLREDGRARIWAGTDNGLFLVERSGASWSARLVAPPHALLAHGLGVITMLVEPSGRLWAGGPDGLLRRDDDGTWVHYAMRKIFNTVVYDIAEKDGRLWLGLATGVLVFRPGTASADAPLRAIDVSRPCPGSRDRLLLDDDPCLIGAAHGLPRGPILALKHSPAGRTWIGTDDGVAYLDKGRLNVLREPEPIAGKAITSFAFDRSTGLWIGSVNGAARLDMQGLVSYTDRDGLGHRRVHAFYEDGAGTLFAVTGDWMLNRFTGNRFDASSSRMIAAAGFVWRSAVMFLDGTGAWWRLTTAGLQRVPRASTLDAALRLPPELSLTTADGLPHDAVQNVAEDDFGDLWIATVSRNPTNLARWRRRSGTVEPYSVRNAGGPVMPRAFARAHDGWLWIGFAEGALARTRGEQFEVFTAQGIPEGITDLHVDGRGALWIASSSAGLARVESVSPAVRLVRYTTREGLSTNNIHCLAEDADGRLYLGTARGIDRLDPRSGAVARLTTADGLASDFVTAAFRDRSGVLWFGTLDGVSRLVPGRDRLSVEPRVSIAALSIAGAMRPLSELGEAQVEGLRLEPGRNHLQIGFMGIAGDGGSLRYRYRLEGGDGLWVGPTDQRVVHYAGLSPGRYRFSVQAIAADGTASTQPADVAFTVVPPVWQRSWFIASASLAAASLLYMLHRFRTAQLLELERIRTRIASDLHDDLGANLSQIAVISEVARQSVRGEVALAEPLAAIATTSRESLDAVSDIVWAIDPRRDSVTDLAQRLRRFASDALSAKDIAVSFSAPADGDLPVDPEVRRELLLIFKEGVNNIVRHSGCKEARIAVSCGDGRLTLLVEDDGRGFDQRQAGGVGLRSIRQRAERLGGELTVRSSPGSGTTLLLRLPVRVSRRARWSRFLPA